MAQQPIPATMDDLVSRYGRLITFVVHRTIPHHLSPEDLQDLQQDVVLAVMETDYLARCRKYAAAYSFTSSLRELTKNVALKWLRRRHAKMRDPKREVSFEATLQPSPDLPDTARPVRDASTLRVVDDVDTRALHTLRIERVRQHLIARNRVIGRRPAVEVLDEALSGDGSLAKYALRRMKHYVEDLHA